MRRLNITFSDKAFRELEELAEKEGKTLSEVIRDALALEHWFDDTRQNGGRVLVERNGKAREIVPTH